MMHVIFYPLKYFSYSWYIQNKCFFTPVLKNAMVLLLCTCAFMWKVWVFPCPWLPFPHHFSGTGTHLSPPFCAVYLLNVFLKIVCIWREDKGAFLCNNVPMPWGIKKNKIMGTISPWGKHLEREKSPNCQHSCHKHRANSNTGGKILCEETPNVICCFKTFPKWLMT